MFSLTKEKWQKLIDDHCFTLQEVIQQFQGKAKYSEFIHSHIFGDTRKCWDILKGVMKDATQLKTKIRNESWNLLYSLCEGYGNW